jgi:hypothetical protein
MRGDMLLFLGDTDSPFVDVDVFYEDCANVPTNQAVSRAHLRGLISYRHKRSESGLTEFYGSTVCYRYSAFGTQAFFVLGAHNLLPMPNYLSLTVSCSTTFVLHDS